jgi:hypothetical protein
VVVGGTIETMVDGTAEEASALRKDTCWDLVLLAAAPAGEAAMAMATEDPGVVLMVAMVAGSYAAVF